MCNDTLLLKRTQLEPLLYLDKNRDVSRLALNGLDLSKRVADNDPMFKESLAQLASVPTNDVVPLHTSNIGAENTFLEPKGKPNKYKCQYT